MRLQIKDFAAIREADIQFDGATVSQTVAVEHLNIKGMFRNHRPCKVYFRCKLE